KTDIRMFFGCTVDLRGSRNIDQGYQVVAGSRIDHVCAEMNFLLSLQNKTKRRRQHAWDRRRFPTASGNDQVRNTSWKPTVCGCGFLRHCDNLLQLLLPHT